jgi:hypothetical protein
VASVAADGSRTGRPVGALACLWRRGLRVPEDVSAAGIGGTRAATAFDMTTMTLPLMELGRLAARHIVAAEAETEVPEPPPCTLRVGTTTAPHRWVDAGAVFDEAMAYADATDPALRAQGVERLDLLGATATADRIRPQVDQTHHRQSWGISPHVPDPSSDRR